MSELIIILKAFGYVSISIIALAILIPLSFYMYNKRNSSNIYRHIEFSIVFVLFMLYAHSWSNDESFLLSFWMITIFGFILIHALIHFNPVKERKINKRRIK